MLFDYGISQNAYLQSASSKDFRGELGSAALDKDAEKTRMKPTVSRFMVESQKYQAAFLLPQRQKVSQSWRQEWGPCVKAACAGLLPPSSWEFSALI